MSLAQFAARRSLAQTRYAQFVADGIKAPPPWQQLKGQVFLGDEHFVEKLQSRTPECAVMPIAVVILNNCAATSRARRLPTSA